MESVLVTVLDRPPKHGAVNHPAAGWVWLRKAELINYRSDFAAATTVLRITWPNKCALSSATCVWCSDMRRSISSEKFYGDWLADEVPRRIDTLCHWIGCCVDLQQQQQQQHQSTVSTLSRTVFRSAKTLFSLTAQRTAVEQFDWRAGFCCLVSVATVVQLLFSVISAVSVPVSYFAVV